MDLHTDLEEGAREVSSFDVAHVRWGWWVREITQTLPSKLSRMFCVRSCHRSPVPGQLQAPRQQPDLAPEARGEARAAAGPDLPEAPGGQMEVGRLNSGHAAWGIWRLVWGPGFQASGHSGLIDVSSCFHFFPPVSRAFLILKGTAFFLWIIF